mmetsp:Transcript_73338/g.122494  ORF Transcript_73338/g.122494 Transcript_73338/m.122494 type:complete len:223 (-) Transcript_73338:427-1095(-)
MFAVVAAASAFVGPREGTLLWRATPRHSLSTSVMHMHAGVLTRREFAASLMGMAVMPALLPVEVLAESTLVTRQQAYSRYVPRIERGRDYWSTGLKKAIASGDWGTIKTALEKKGSIDRIFGPMELWASSYSSKTISPKTLEMNAAIDELREAAADLQAAASGTEAGGGMFSFITGPKKMDESKRITLANAAYTKGVSAINTYIDLGNDGLGMQFTQLDTID